MRIFEIIFTVLALTLAASAAGIVGLLRWAAMGFCAAIGIYFAALFLVTYGFLPIIIR